MRSGQHRNCGNKSKKRLPAVTMRWLLANVLSIFATLKLRLDINQYIPMVRGWWWKEGKLANGGRYVAPFKYVLGPWPMSVHSIVAGAGSASPVVRLRHQLRHTDSLWWQMLLRRWICILYNHAPTLHLVITATCNILSDSISP